jgi:hypothetical protein
LVRNSKIVKLLMFFKNEFPPPEEPVEEKQ